MIQERRNSRAQLPLSALPFRSILNAWQVSGSSRRHSPASQPVGTFNSGSRRTERLVQEVRRMKKCCPASRAQRCSPSFGVPFALSFPWGASGKSQISPWKEGGHLAWTQREIRLPHPHPHTPLLRCLQMVITTVYKLTRSLAGRGTGSERRGVIGADLSAASRAAASSSAAGAVMYVSFPFAHGENFFRQT